ncbi:PhnA protein [Flavobacterium branchiophilum]|uniref:PhnA protein n=2 Tax=Flavobacterium branchiophilum TaxID=55197 RepID=G2Z7V1_FLABF|nr:alkylphosphonate utilization protein [Flavobacterium branchiophilum]OXA72070.1 PhnA protein [Flavobacterium branchiophilum] [Flavobacterium branchiophilum NBRC 15030 = ATCC 35035]PDS22515.1 PhnA protein [Flavobacterium branchiophilum]TQM39335.1 protein PhnA [Flavobacterium branchiophilum]CCB70076.1 PhnA protein [Flavobacterium branchiophilum FL-15]GEM55756.1 PhnA protein [Flavobacterium branchiophilum NBRC 15030 = ATCC 35035]
MSVIEKKLKDRSGAICEISGTEHDLVVYTLAPYTAESLEHSVLIAQNLKNQIENPETTDEKDWRGLSESMWSEHLPVQILSYRMLARLKNNDLLEMMYLEEEALNWAKATGEGEEEDENKVVHKDSNGAVLKDGDSVVLIKDLDVKGATFTAKRGAAVHHIKLVWDDANLIEGRVENQNIYILTQYVKKTK